MKSNIFKILLVFVLIFSYSVIASAEYAGFAITSAVAPYKSDYKKCCVDEFGSNWRQADWSEIKSFYDSGGDLKKLVSEVGLDTKSAWVTRNWVTSYSSTRDYFAAYHNHNKPSNFLAHDNIDNYFISLGSWYNSRYVLCKRTNAVHTITASAGIGGIISPSGAVSVNNGASQTFTITVNSGYQISDVLVDGISQGPISSFTFTNVTSNHTISASFDENQPNEPTISITVNDSNGPIVLASDAQACIKVNINFNKSDPQWQEV